MAGVSRANDTQDEASGMVNVEVFNFVVTNFTAPRDVISHPAQTRQGGATLRRFAWPRFTVSCLAAG